MTYEHYFGLAIDEFPDLHLDKIPGYNKVDVVKRIGLSCFIAGSCQTVLADETRRQLIHLQEEGQTCFD